MYQPHPSPKLQDLFKAKPYQGAPPEDAEFVFVGLDANYAADIERKEDVFKLVEEYHGDGVRFWRDKGHHHPFLADGYRGSGRRYHETFAEIGLVRNDASRVSFIELLHVPTVGTSELERADFDAAHLDRINKLVVSEQPRHIFVSSKVVALMRRSKRFDWLRGKRPNFEELPELYKEGSTTVYQIYHFSAWGTSQRACACKPERSCAWRGPTTATRAPTDSTLLERLEVLLGADQTDGMCPLERDLRLTGSWLALNPVLTWEARQREHYRNMVDRARS